jgi:hypothetical protein
VIQQIGMNPDTDRQPDRFDYLGKILHI